ncbi:hypothetical protein G6F43_001355 [Rhizopus delemar]|nr:hypothetical protein G6F43_001355 [Rhizopus delemar]
MDRRTLSDQTITLDWNHSNAKIFIHNLNPNTTQSVLFEAFKSLDAIETCLMDNKNSLYGIVSFPTRIHAEIAALKMNGRSILSFPIEIYVDENENNSNSASSRRSSSNDSDVSLTSMAYENIFAKTPLYHTTIYIKNLSENVTKQEIRSVVQQYGEVNEIEIRRKMMIIKLDTHANASTAIFNLQGTMINNKPIRSGWWTKDIIGQDICLPLFSSVTSPTILDTTFMRAPAPTFVYSESIHEYY